MGKIFFDGDPRILPYPKKGVYPLMQNQKPLILPQKHPILYLIIKQILSHTIHIFRPIFAHFKTLCSFQNL